MESCGKIFISKKNLLFNIESVKKQLKNKKICFMVKANAYGHGIEEIVKLSQDYVDWYGVSNVNEAMRIRVVSKFAKILIVGKTNSFSKCAKNRFSFFIESKEHFYNLLEYLNKNPCDKKFIKIHLKVNCGMNRLGISEVNEFIEIYNLSLKHKIFIEGVATHFSTPDCNKKIYIKQQRKFKEFLQKIPFNENPIISIGGSGIINQEILGNKFNFNMIRTGLILYGYGSKALKLKPVLSVNSHLIKIFTLKKGEFLGYGNGYMASSDIKIGVVPLGYGDGVSRNLSNNFSVIINKKKAQSVGFICMDMFFVDLTNIKAKVGDKVIVFNNAKKWAKLLGTIPYEVLTNFRLIR